MCGKESMEVFMPGEDQALKHETVLQSPQVSAFVAGASWWEKGQTDATLTPIELAMATAVAEDRYYEERLVATAPETVLQSPQVSAFVAGAAWWYRRQTDAIWTPIELAMTTAIGQRYYTTALRGEQPKLF